MGYTDEAFKVGCRRILKENGLIVVIYNHVLGREECNFLPLPLKGFQLFPQVFQSCYLFDILETEE